MQRRIFIRNTVLSAVAVSASGFIKFNGQFYEGDCETTTDILGPFYRPDAPVRSNMRIANSAGELLELSGQIKHKDCKTPLKNAVVELWHCDGNGVYDNDTPEFKYRAKTYADKNGNYSFKTILPVPYDAGGGNFRPAHFHMMVSAPDYQSLITQLYFSGDKNIAKDGSASLPAAKSRILKIKKGMNGEQTVLFNVTMLKKIPADAAVINRLAGTYQRGDNKEKTEEFYKKENLLWIRDASSINGGYPLQYIGNNVFEYYGWPSKYQFSLLLDGSVKIVYTGTTWENNKEGWEAVKKI
ncbi:MAG: catechol 1,2-dioxygenase [Bacteroidota bacterium]